MLDASQSLLTSPTFLTTRIFEIACPMNEPTQPTTPPCPACSAPLDLQQLVCGLPGVVRRRVEEALKEMAQRIAA
jgi:hypothetical protein